MWKCCQEQMHLKVGWLENAIPRGDVGRWKSQYKGPEVGVCLPCSGNGREANSQNEVKEGRKSRKMNWPKALVRTLAFYSKIGSCQRVSRLVILVYFSV